MSKTVKANDYPPKERPDRRKREAWPEGAWPIEIDELQEKQPLDEQFDGAA